MFKNYITTAIRNFWKNKLFAVINIIGLGIGLAVFVFANLFADYEKSYDTFFKNAERIYVVKSDINPIAKIGIQSIDSSYPAIGGFIAQEIPEAEKVATSYWTELIVGRDETKFYQSINLVDQDYLDIFQFDFIEGSSNQALKDTNSLVVTEKTAIKYFGRTNVLGETLTLNNDRVMKITGVIRNLPLNSHLVKNLMSDETLEMIANAEVGKSIFGDDFMSNWNNLSTSIRTYVLFAPGVDPFGLEPRLDAIVDKYAPENSRDIIERIGFRPLVELNLGLWHAIGIPGILIMRFLGLVVLGIACINFINLATAQALGRAREIGIRKTMGASRGRLAVQFLVESVVITFFALIIAIGVIEYALPAFNTATDKAMTFSYFSNLKMIGFLLATVLAVGLLAGSFPALLLARLEASNALKGSMALGKWGIRFRKLLVVSQNTFSVFLIITVMISFYQTKAIENRDLGFNGENTQVLLRVNRAGVNENYETLKAEIERIPGVRHVTGASQVPYDQSNSETKFNTVREESSATRMSIMSVDYNFFDAFEIPLLAGRELSKDHAGDFYAEDIPEDSETRVNVVIGRSAVKAFGWGSPEDALGKSFFGFGGNAGNRIYVVVGVTEDVLIQGFHNEQKPFVYFVRPGQFITALVKYNPPQKDQVLSGIEAAWTRVLPDYPILSSSLDEFFDSIFVIFKNINNGILGFAIMALLIATIGLFGLSAFMAEKRIREVGIRKTFGASTGKLVRLLTFQFSRPVIWAILFGWVLAALGYYLTQGFFAQVMPQDFRFFSIFIFGGIFSLVLAWITVGANAYRAANTNPVNSLHYE